MPSVTARRFVHCPATPLTSSRNDLPISCDRSLLRRPPRRLDGRRICVPMPLVPIAEDPVCKGSKVGIHYPSSVVSANVRNFSPEPHDQLTLHAHAPRNDKRHRIRTMSRGETMTKRSTRVRRLLIGTVALGVVIGGGATTAGAAVPATGSPSGTAAHHVRLDPKNGKDSETSPEASVQDHSGQSEASSTEVASKDASQDATDPSNSDQAKDSQGSPGSMETGTSFDPTTSSTGIPTTSTHPDTSQGS